MSEPKREISIRRLKWWPRIAYEVWEGHGGVYVDTPQEAFDYVAEHYPGEPVQVDIRP